MLTKIFETVLDMSLVGCYSILVVMTVRLFLRRCGRKYAYFLWLAVFVNLCFPIALKGPFYLIPDPVAEFSVSEAVEGALRDGGTTGNNPVHPAVWLDGTSGLAAGTEEGMEGVSFLGDTASLLLRTGAGVWLTGVFLLLGFNLGEALKLKRQIAREKWASVSPDGGIVEVEGLTVPFLYGFFRPRVYLPTDLEPQEREYVTAHELYHKRRKDHLAKAAVFLVLAVHWFNPLVWAAYVLLSRDMEISCDEAVLSQAQGNIRKQYAGSLLKYAAKQNGYILASLTFGEPAVKTRIKNVLRFRKRGLLISVLGALCALAVAAGLHRPAVEATDPGTPVHQDAPGEGGMGSILPAEPAGTIAPTAELAALEPTAGTALCDGWEELLQAMCYYVPDFAGPSDMTEDFWKQFIFLSYTGVNVDENGFYRPIYGEGEHVWVYREDLGFEEGEFCIEESDVREYAELIFGVEMPRLHPAFEDMRDGQTALYYKEGAYYIGDSDFGEQEYRFREWETDAEGGRIACYDILLFNEEGVQESVGTVRFRLAYADNEHGFVILSRVTELTGI